MRSPGREQVNFAAEEFLDEIAAGTGQYPLAIRLRYLGENLIRTRPSPTKPRMTAVLQAVREAAGWQTRPSPGPDAICVTRSRAAACRSSRVRRSSYIATVAEVEVDRKTGKVTVTKMTSVVDAVRS